MRCLQVSSVAIALNDMLIVSGSRDRTVRVWNVDFALHRKFLCFALGYHERVGEASGVQMICLDIIGVVFDFLMSSNPICTSDKV